MPQTITNNAQIEYQYEASNGTVSLETQTNYVTTNISQNHIKQRCHYISIQKIIIRN